jgi:hypothetical protein
MSKTIQYIRYATYYTCLRAWGVGEAPTLHDIKEILNEDSISKDTINRFLPESKLKTISENLPGVRLTPYRSLSESILLPSDIGLVRAYVNWYHSECDRRFMERMVKDPELREFKEKIKKGSPVLDKIFQKILKAKATA